MSQPDPRDDLQVFIDDEIAKDPTFKDALAVAADRVSGYLRVPVEGLEERLAKAIHAADCGCVNYPDPWYFQLADGAMAALLTDKAGEDA